LFAQARSADRFGRKARLNVVLGKREIVEQVQVLEPLHNVVYLDFPILAGVEMPLHLADGARAGAEKPKRGVHWPATGSLFCFWF